MLITYSIYSLYQRSTEWEGPFSKRWNNHYWKTCEEFKELEFKEIPVDEAMQKCKQKCENESGCNALLFRKVSVSCYLKKCPTPVPIPDRPVDDGIKIAYFLPGKRFKI